MSKFAFLVVGGSFKECYYILQIPGIVKQNDCHQIGQMCSKLYIHIKGRQVSRHYEYRGCQYDILKKYCDNMPLPPLQLLYLITSGARQHSFSLWKTTEAFIFLYFSPTSQYTSQVGILVAKSH